MRNQTTLITSHLQHYHYHTECHYHGTFQFIVHHCSRSYHSLFNFDISLVNTNADRKNIVSNILHVVNPQDVASSFHNRINPHSAEDIAAVPNKHFTLAIHLFILFVFIDIIN